MLARYINKIKRIVNKKVYSIKRNRVCKSVKCKDFTVISNNCWAGKVYQYLDLPYLSPTVGLYFFAEDYILFLSNLEYYLSVDLQFIKAEESKYAQLLEQRKQIDVPIGKLDDVEIVFLHYSSESEAKEKWERRKQRVNFDKLIVKFSNMNLCTEKLMEKFATLPYENKILLNIRKKPKYDCEIYWVGKKSQTEVLNDTEPFPGNLSLKKILRFK